MTNQNDLKIEVLYDAPREEVFSNWTDADKVRTWFAPDGFEVTSCTMLAQPGGVWRVEYRSANGLHYVEQGEFSLWIYPNGWSSRSPRLRRVGSFWSHS